MGLRLCSIAVVLGDPAVHIETLVLEVAREPLRRDRLLSRIHCLSVIPLDL